MKKAISFFKKFKGFFLAFFLVALAFLAVGLGTLGSVYSAGAAYELEDVKRHEGNNDPTVIFRLPSSFPDSDATVSIVDVYVNVAVIYKEAGTPVTLTLQRTTSSSSNVNDLNWYTSSSYKFDGTLENFYTPAPVLDDKGNPPQDYKEPTAKDVFYRFTAPFTSALNGRSWNMSSSARYWGLTVSGGNVLLNEVVFIGERETDNADVKEKVVIPGVEVVYAAYGEELPAHALERAQALVDAQPKSVPSLEPTAYSRFTNTEVPTLMTISEMRRGNAYATNADPEATAAVDTYHVDRVYGAFGTDFIALGAAIFGLSPFGVRFFPLLAAFGALIVLSRFVTRLLRSEKAGFVFALLFATAGITLSLAHVGTPLMLGIFFFACALDLVHRFYAKGMKKASLLSTLPLLAAGLFGAAAICVNGAFIIPMAGVVALFVLGMFRMKKSRDHQLEKIVAEPEEAPMPANAPALQSVADEEAPVRETREQRAAKVLSDHRFKRVAAPLIFAVGLVVGAFLFALVGMIPAYYAYLKFYDDPASPSLNVFALAWHTFANGFVGSNAFAGDTTWNFFYTLFRSEANFSSPTGTVFSVLGFCVNWVAMLAALAGLVFVVVRLVLLVKNKADGRTMRIALRRTLIPLVLLCLSLIAAVSVKSGLVFVLLAWLFAFVLAADLFGGKYEGKMAKGVKIAGIVGVVLLVAVFGLLLVFNLGIPLPANILAKIFK